MLRESLGTFLFDAFEGLGELEGLFLEQRVAWEWVLTATQKDRKEGWLERGLYSGASWQKDFFLSMFAFIENEREESTKRDMISKVGELLVMLPQMDWSGSYVYRLCAGIENFSKEMDKSWLLGELALSSAGLSSKEWKQKCFTRLLESIQSIQEEGQRVLGIIRFAKALGEGIMFESWSEELVHELLEELAHVRNKRLVQETSLFLHEKFLGHEKQHTEWAGSERVGEISLRCFVLASTNHPDLRGLYAKRLCFAWEETRFPQKIGPLWFEKGLILYDDLESWSHRETTLDGQLLWEKSGRAALLRLLQRDFCGIEDLSWKTSYFYELLERIQRLKKPSERRELIRLVAETLHRSQKEKEHEEMIMSLFVESEPFGVDVSCIHEGLAWSYVEVDELTTAEEHARKVEEKVGRDKLYKKMIELYLQWSRPEQALVLLGELHSLEERGEAALLCARSRAVGEDPLACAMLCEEALRQTEKTEQLLEALIQNPFLSGDAKSALKQEALFSASGEQYLSQLARKERLEELERLKEHLPEKIYREERKRLLGLKQDGGMEAKRTSKEKREPSASKKDVEELDMCVVMLDLPHRYGDNHYISPRKHIEKNHFSRDVGGSVFTLWPDFQSLWDDVKERVDEELRKRAGEKLSVFGLVFPIEVGLTGVIPLEKAPTEFISIEERNGQPSLFCGQANARQPTKEITFVVGVSEVKEDEIEGYEGHFHRHALYTVYPGRPSSPFPHCDREDAKDLRESFERAIVMLRDGKIRQAKKTLLDAYLQLKGEVEWAHYWSEHILVR